MNRSQSQTSLSSMDGSGNSMNKQRKGKERNGNKNYTRSTNENGGKRIFTIGRPENVQHIGHIGWDPQGGFDVNNLEMYGSWKKLLDSVGVTEEKMQRKETRDFIYDFVEKRGSIENATQELELERKSGSVPPAPPATSRGQSRGPPLPPPPSSGALSPPPARLGSAPPPPPPPSRGVLPPPPPMGRPTPPRSPGSLSLPPPMGGASTYPSYRRRATRDQSQWRQSGPDDAGELDRYEMGEAPRGICLVINNFNFLGEEQRQGAKADEDAIVRLFDELHFIVEIRQNLSGLGILKVAQEMAARDHSKYAAFVFFIMSHGDKKDVIYGVDNRKAGMEDVISEFTPTNCPTLENKPKLFFIQACRGQKSDSRMQRLSASKYNLAEDSIQMIHSPDADIANGLSAQEADFLLAFSTVPGYKAWRSKQAGSWFIQVLVDVIRRFHHRHHLLDMLTEVNKQVADIANDFSDVDLSFQVPSPTHTLRAQVFL